MIDYGGFFNWFKHTIKYRYYNRTLIMFVFQWVAYDAVKLILGLDTTGQSY